MKLGGGPLRDTKRTYYVLKALRLRVAGCGLRGRACLHCTSLPISCLVRDRRTKSDLCSVIKRKAQKTH